MAELKNCPFCGKNKVFIGVHDDEGNYHGLLGCEYESDPWSGLSYALHHDGWGECILCSSGDYHIMGGVLFDTAEEAANAWNRRAEPDVVHCCDCEMRQNKDMLLPSGLTERVCFCTYWQSKVYPEDFCSYGEREEDEYE